MRVHFLELLNGVLVDLEDFASLVVFFDFDELDGRYGVLVLDRVWRHAITSGYLLANVIWVFLLVLRKLILLSVMVKGNAIVALVLVLCIDMSASV